MHGFEFLSHQSRIAVNKFSTWGLYSCAGELDIVKIDKISTDLSCFMFQFGGLELCLGGAKRTLRERYEIKKYLV